MKIVLLCATRRGLEVLKTLVELAPECELVVFSFREEPGEPPFLDAIREFTISRNGEFFETRQMRTDAIKHFWESSTVDLMLVVSWRYLIPSNVFQRPRLGTFVFHDSLLPKYRGFSPTVWAMINGEDHIGVTLFRISEDMDAGDIVDQDRVEIESNETIARVLDRVTGAYLCLLERNLENLLRGTTTAHPQDHSQATYCCRRLPADNEIDWSCSSERIFNLVRGVTRPYSGAYTWLAGKKATIWKAALPAAARSYAGRVPGRVVEILPGTGALVLTGNGMILVTEMQLEEGQAICAAEMLNSPSVTLGR